MSSAAYDKLRHVTTATLTTMLLKKGIRRCRMDGPMPLAHAGQRLIGPALQSHGEAFAVNARNATPSAVQQELDGRCLRQVHVQSTQFNVAVKALPQISDGLIANIRLKASRQDPRRERERDRRAERRRIHANRQLVRATRRPRERLTE